MALVRELVPCGVEPLPLLGQCAAFLRHAPAPDALTFSIGGNADEHGKSDDHTDPDHRHRRVLATLQNEGLLRAQSGVGYFVRRFRHFTYRPQDDFRCEKLIAEVDADSFTQAAKGRNPSQRIEVTMLAAPPDVARRLRLGEGEFVVLRRRLRLLDGEPFQLNDSYYPRDVAEGTEVMQPGDIVRGANQVLADHGFVQVRALDEIWVRMPRPDEVERLQIPPGTPVAEHIVTGLTREGRPVRMVRAVLPGDRNVLTFDRVHPDHVGDAE